MTAAYDTYDYPKYWRMRGYEHDSEVIAISAFLNDIPSTSSLVDIGCGFGRLVPAYKGHVEKITLVDPSSQLLRIAKKDCVDLDITFKKSEVSGIRKVLPQAKYDTALMVRVMHHVEDIDEAFGNINQILKKDGHFILEFANKLHGKALFLNLLRGNFTFPIDIFPIDIRSRRNKKRKSIAFINYHPSIVKEKLSEHGFEILEIRSVSNFRSPIFKKLVPEKALLWLESKLQEPLSKVYFGPSIFILAKKK